MGPLFSSGPETFGSTTASAHGRLWPKIKTVDQARDQVDRLDRRPLGNAHMPVQSLHVGGIRERARAGSPVTCRHVFTPSAPCPPGHAGTAASRRRNRLDRGFLDGFKNLLDDLRVERRAAMERNHDPSPTLCVDPMTTLGPQPNETRPQQRCFRLRGGQARQFRHELRRRW